MTQAQAVDEKISQLVDAISDQLIALRRSLHQIPELGHKERRTAKMIAGTLRDLGRTPVCDVGGTGVTLDFAGQSTRMIGYRADIDALPIQEQTGVPYQSKQLGVMHACGHDVHTTIALGVAHVLDQLEPDLPGGVRVLFQPAEELQPGGSLGMIDEGALNGIEAIFALHVDPSIEVGTIGLKRGPHLASVDTFEIEVIGTTGHAAHPHLSIDAISIAAKIVEAVQHIRSRATDPVKPLVLSFTTIHAGNAKNVLPSSVKLSGTFRTLDSQLRDEMPGRMEAIVAGLTRTYGAEYRFEMQKGSPVLVNSPECMAALETAARVYPGEGATMLLDVPRMGSEDFANYLEHIPGAMFRLGTCGGPETAHPLHSPQFNVDERAIPLGVKFAVLTLLTYFDLYAETPPVN